MSSSEASVHLARAVALACESVTSARGGPFGAVIVARDGRVVGEGSNQVTTALDPTAHAEIVAIRQACWQLNGFSLAGCALYASCEPCPMCLAAAYWARIDAIYFAAWARDAAAAGFDDLAFYEELARPPPERRVPAHRVELSDGDRPFALWTAQADRVRY